MSLLAQIPDVPEGTKLILLTQGFSTTVDECDHAAVSAKKWHVMKCAHTCYAAHKIHDGENGRTILLHRLLMSPPSGFEVDHINGNGLDNRRSNLRLCTKSENMANRGTARRGFRGVYQHKGSKNFHAKITVSGRVLYLGNYQEQTAAARAYDVAASKYFGHFARLNFPAEAK